MNRETGMVYRSAQDLTHGDQFLWSGRWVTVEEIRIHKYLRARNSLAVVVRESNGKAHTLFYFSDELVTAREATAKTRLNISRLRWFVFSLSPPRRRNEL